MVFVFNVQCTASPQSWQPSTLGTLSDYQQQHYKLQPLQSVMYEIRTELNKFQTFSIDSSSSLWLAESASRLVYQLEWKLAGLSVLSSLLSTGLSRSRLHILFLYNRVFWWWWTQYDWNVLRLNSKTRDRVSEPLLLQLVYIHIYHMIIIL